jgi:hypothetical protein
MRLDDPRIQENWAVRTAEERAKLRSDGGDPIVALRVHFEENVERLRQQIERVDGELRSLAVQRRAFVAALEALDAEQNPRVTTQHVTPEH